MAERNPEFTNLRVAPLGTYSRGVVITPNDGADLANNTMAVWVGGAGNLNVDLLDGSTVLFSGIPAGTLMPLRVKRIRSTSTTATLIVALD